MAKFTLAKALALASMIGLVFAQEVAPCGEVCITDGLRGTEVGCAEGAMDCVCSSATLTTVISDCVRRNCAGAVENVEVVVAAASNSALAVCATAILPAQTPAATTPPPAAESTPVPEETSTPTPAASTTERPTPEQAPQSTATDSSSTTKIAAASTSSTSSTSLPTSAGDSSSSQDEEEDEDNSSPAGGLSTGAKAGIGIGVSVVALALIGVAAWLFLRRRAAKSGSSVPYNISGPLPGGGRDFGDSGSDFQRGGSSDRGPMAESDFSARRYEDMLPRVQPTSMI